MAGGSFEAVAHAPAKAVGVPNHIGLIIDGNRRWARKHHMQSWEGHGYGAEKLEKVLTWCADLKIPQVSVYLLSTENFSRSKNELDVIFELLCKYLARADFFNRHGIRVRVLGDQKKLTRRLVGVTGKTVIETAENKKMILNLLVGYGSHFELMEAIKKIVENSMKTGRIEITPKDVESNLLVPTPVDLVIRTGGRRRLSNFMLWQTSYAEIYVTETLWPDFSKEELLKSIEWFNSVKRNFGR